MFRVTSFETSSLLARHSSLLTHHYLSVSVAKITPVVFTRRHKAVPVLLETVGKPPHSAVQPGSPAQRAQIIAIGFMLGETDDFAVAQFAQECYVSLADRRAEISAAREQFRLFEKIGRCLIGLEPLAENNARFALRFFLATAADKARYEFPNQIRRQGQGGPDNHDLRNSG